ncbi:hypothetical protein [Pelotalea chapellei]|uniref:DUF4136 domain-containing protein n=1 Tax=Pelotalea chapellei TaxID=44671 RepID=A0ABS5U5X3_9BACT|nr:hypothetical protein [Pelotalea chapellei]MBT1071052.1 hypothetical protein [Pelotalea chapellei]
MNRSLLATVISGLVVALFSGGCSSTTITSHWKDQSYQGPPRKIMVVGVAKKPSNRRVFEDEFVRRLREADINAIASYPIIPDQKQGNEKLIAAKVKESGADAVLITRFGNRKTVRTYVPGTMTHTPSSFYYGAWRDHYPAYYGTWPDYYGYGSQMVYTPGYVDEDEYALMETNLYAAGDNRLIWSASSETEIRGSDEKMIKSFIGRMVKTMKEQKVL